MSQHTLKLVLVSISAACGIVLVLIVAWNRRRLNRALHNMEHINIDGARQQFGVAALSNDLAHEKQDAKLKEIKGGMHFLQAAAAQQELDKLKANQSSESPQ